MPRILIPTIQLPGSGGQEAAIAVNVSALLVAGDSVNDHYWMLRARDVLFVYNAGGVARTITLYSVANSTGRKTTVAGTEVHSIPAAARAYFGPFSTEGWMQGGADQGRVFVDVEHADIKLGILRK